MLDDRELADKGSRAENALPYIEELLQAAKDIVLDNLVNLSADETFKFSYYKAQLNSFDDVKNLAIGDISEGSRAIDRIQGNHTQKGGIL